MVPSIGRLQHESIRIVKRGTSMEAYLLRGYARAKREAEKAEGMGWEIELNYARGQQEMARDILFQMFDIEFPEDHLQEVG